MNLNNPYIFHARFKVISRVVHGGLFSKVYLSIGKHILQETISKYKTGCLVEKYIAKSRIDVEN